MNNRVLMIVTVLLVTLVIVLHLGEDSRHPAVATGQPFLPALGTLADELSTITVSRGGNETVATLDRDGDRWTVRERDGYPADMTRIRETLSALAEARIVEPKTASERFYDRLGVESVALPTATGTRITFTGRGETIAVVIGDLATAGQRFARLEDAEQSYQIDRDPAPARSIADWLDARILDLPNERIQQVTIDHADGERLTLSRPEAGQPNFTIEPIPEGRELMYPGVGNTIGGALRSLRLEDVRVDAGSPPADAAPDDTAAELATSDVTTSDVTVEYRTFDGLVITIHGSRHGNEAWTTFLADVDAEAADVDLAARQAEADTINDRVAGWRYRLPAFQYEQMTRRMADLLQSG
jgi:hypothetical protein